jgi:hypothetical protein
MTMPAPIRRIGRIAALSICIVLYTLLHLKVNAVHAEVVRAERQIVQLEEQNLLLETEFLTRSNHVQLAKLNRINFGFRAPEAAQFLQGKRELAQFSSPRSVDAPAPIRLAGIGAEDDLPPFPELVSPLTGRRVDAGLAAPGSDDSRSLASAILPGGARPLRVTIAALPGDVSQ